MTTFHELLGTDDSYSIIEIKKKYHQLSNRLHPDKGGSQALMQMLCIAYQQIIKGYGNKKYADAIIELSENDIQDYALENKISKIEKEKEKLQHLLEQHKQNVDYDFYHDENSAQQTLILLQVTENRLNKQLVLLQSQLDEEENTTHMSKKANKKLRILMLIVFFIIVLGSVFYYKIQNWFQSAQYSSLISTPLTVQVKNVIATQPATDDDTDSMKSAARIMMMRTIGLWQQRYYEGTRQPYIAVRSINGSYIVKDCQGRFSYYSNQTHNTAHVPANLIFSAKDRQFLVYRIPYGNGSSEQQWLNSKSLVINDNVFSNNGYQSSALALASVCLNTTPY